MANTNLWAGERPNVPKHTENEPSTMKLNGPGRKCCCSYEKEKDELRIGHVWTPYTGEKMSRVPTFGVRVFTKVSTYGSTD